MRITILCAGHSLGDERVVCRQAYSLAKNGHDVLVLGRSDVDKAPPSHPRLTLQSVEPLIRGGSLKSRLLRIKALFKIFKKAVASKPDIVAAHEPDSALVALLVRNKIGVPVHFDIHECFEEMLASRFSMPIADIVRFITSQYMRQIAKRCDWISVVSPVIEAQYLSIRHDDRVILLYNSPPIDLFPVCNQNVNGSVTVCHEGWLDHARGMKQLLQAVSLANKNVDLHMLFVGSVRPHCEKDFAAILEELKVNHVVEVTGWLSYDKVGIEDSRAQIGVVSLQPSGNNFGGLSNKIFSYMACGQAVIVPQGSASAQLVEKYDCGIAIDITNPNDIAHAITILAKDEQLRKRLGDNGRHAIVSLFDWSKMSIQLIDIYKQLQLKSI